MSTTHWHYAVCSPSKLNKAVIETMTGAEKDLSKDQAKAVLQPMIRQVQGIARYQDPVNPAIVREPADWWMLHKPLEWLWLPTAPDLMFAVYECTGNCISSAIAFRNELAEQYRQHTGMEVEVQSPN